VLTLQAFKQTWINQRHIHSRVEYAGLRAMRRTGVILRRAARGKIRRRIVTDAMRGRLRAAQAAGDRRRVNAILKTMQARRSTTGAAGGPPVAHVPDHPVRSIRAIYFAATAKSVIVGPVKALGVVFTGSNRQTVPELLEFGGIGTVNEISIDGGATWQRRQSKRRVNKPGVRNRQRTTSYRPHSFMNPTLREQTPAYRQVIASTFRSYL
jgi:hypothetical protein